MMVVWIYRITGSRYKVLSPRLGQEIDGNEGGAGEKYCVLETFIDSLGDGRL